MLHLKTKQKNMKKQFKFPVTAILAFALFTSAVVISCKDKEEETTETEVIVEEPAPMLDDSTAMSGMDTAATRPIITNE